MIPNRLNITHVTRMSLYNFPLLRKGRGSKVSDCDYMELDSTTASLRSGTSLIMV